MIFTSGCCFNLHDLILPGDQIQKFNPESWHFAPKAKVDLKMTFCQKHWKCSKKLKNGLKSRWNSSNWAENKRKFVNLSNKKSWNQLKSWKFSGLKSECNGFVWYSKNPGHLLTCEKGTHQFNSLILSFVNQNQILLVCTSRFLRPAT